MKKTKPIHSEIFQLKQDLLSSLKDRLAFARKIHAIKITNDYSSIGIVSRELKKLSPTFENLIYGNMFPKSYKDLGICNPNFIKPESIDSEINWIIHQIQKHKNSIREFSSVRKNVENNILLGKYRDALKEIEVFQDKFGVSIWGIEMKLVIYNLQNETQKILEYVTEINNSQQNNKTGFVPYLTYMLYKRSNTKLSAYDFDEELASFSKRSRSSFLTDRYNYFEFKLNFYNSIGKNDFSANLLMDTTNSLFDRYDCLVKTIISLFVSASEVRNKYSKVASKVYELSLDERLLTMVSFSNSVPVDFYDSEFINILDLYYTGDYNNCLTNAKLYLLKSPSNIDVLKIACRSMLFMQRDYSQVVVERDSVLNKIGQSIYDLMKGGEVESNIYPLYQIFKNLNGLNISAGLIVLSTRNGIKNITDFLIFLLLIDSILTESICSNNKNNRYNILTMPL